MRSDRSEEEKKSKVPTLNTAAISTDSLSSTTPKDNTPTKGKSTFARLIRVFTPKAKELKEVKEIKQPTVEQKQTKESTYMNSINVEKGERDFNKLVADLPKDIAEEKGRHLLSREQFIQRRRSVRDSLNGLPSEFLEKERQLEEEKNGGMKKSSP